MSSRSGRKDRRSTRQSILVVKNLKSQTTIPTVGVARKSGRKCRSVLEREKQDKWKDKVRMKQSIDGLKVVDIEAKGRGVISTHYIPPGVYICEYAGELLSLKEAAKREEQYEGNNGIGCYMYYFTCKGEKYCVDATKEDSTLGRLINHSKTKPNIRSLIIDVDSTPHIIFYSTRDIKQGEELVYDYGDRSTASLTAHPWLKL